MVNFVLNAHGDPQFVAFHFKKFAVASCARKYQRSGTGDGLVNFGYGQTAFFPTLFVDALCDDFGIDEDQRLIALLRGIHDDDADDEYPTFDIKPTPLALYMVSNISSIVVCNAVKRADRLGNGVQTRIRELLK